MTRTDTQFITDDDGNRIGVLIGLDLYRRLLDAADEIDAIRAYDAAKASGGEAVPFEDAVREIERSRQRA